MHQSTKSPTLQHSDHGVHGAAARGWQLWYRLVPAVVCSMRVAHPCCADYSDPWWRTEQQHVEEVCASVPEGPLLQGLAVSHKEKHVEHKVEAWVEVVMLLHRVPGTLLLLLLLLLLLSLLLLYYCCCLQCGYVVILLFHVVSLLLLCAKH